METEIGFGRKPLIAGKLVIDLDACKGAMALVEPATPLAPPERAVFHENVGMLDDFGVVFAHNPIACARYRGRSGDERRV